MIHIIIFTKIIVKMYHSNIRDIQLIQRTFRRYSRSVRIDKVINILKGKDWSCLYSLCRTFGNTLDSNSMKALKGRIFEIFIQYCDEDCVHVDETGFDITINGIKIEIKTGKSILLTNIGGVLKKNITFRFKNSNGSGKMKISDDNTADIYLLINTSNSYAIAYVKKETVLHNLKKEQIGDLDAKIPNEFVNLLYISNREICKHVEDLDCEINLNSIFVQIIRCIINSIWKKRNTKEDLKKCLVEISNNL